MQTPPKDNDAAPWRRLSRRWLTMLGVMLTINGVTITAALCDRFLHGQSADLVASATEDAAAPLAADNQPHVVEEPPNDATKTTQTTTSDIEIAAESNSSKATEVVFSDATDQAPISASTPVPESPPVETAVATTRPSPPPEPVNPSAETIDPPQQPNAVTPAANASDKLVIINPPTSGGVVHYLVDGKSLSLLPGEYAQTTSAIDKRIAFHRGSDFGDVELRLQTGVYRFYVSTSGWELVPADAASARLLSICRPVE